MVEEKVEDPKLLLKQRCIKCLKGPHLIRTLIVVACIVVVLQQISSCITKLFFNIPITTYTHFDFNQTVLYPSVTFCREPPYKHDKLLEYGLYSHPRYTSTWRSFNFSSISLDELWEEITYNDQDMFVQYGLDGASSNVKLTSQMGFIYGRCYTLSPKIRNSQASKNTGYSITLRHSAADVAASTSIYAPGYHVHIHYTREPYTEVEVYNGGLVDYLFVKVGESLDIKLKVDEYAMISGEDDPCSYKADYSANVCTAQCVWDKVGKETGCSGPWMVSDLPRCDNFTGMRTLIASYLTSYMDHKCSECPRFCRSYLYNGYVTDRQGLHTWEPPQNQGLTRTNDADLQIQLYLYFNSMMVSVYEERYNYDWNLFLSDLGGSIGFLLGLSVIGLMNIFAKTWNLFIKPIIISSRVKVSRDSTATADVKTIEGAEDFK
ncbi:uncharacterized protein LOC115447497 [Manduca sexta]|uniref:uncharacterized protein LOC115447497 n=1 Tax=Manduca sexta TaxID=7130 RepID=UPI00188E1A3B|nr:uncharacterized protein LOC115447497 [Manduca sexta]